MTSDQEKMLNADVRAVLNRYVGRLLTLETKREIIAAIQSRVKHYIYPAPELVVLEHITEPGRIMIVTAEEWKGMRELAAAGWEPRVWQVANV